MFEGSNSVTTQYCLVRYLCIIPPSFCAGSARVWRRYFQQDLQAADGTSSSSRLWLRRHSKSSPPGTRLCVSLCFSSEHCNAAIFSSKENIC